jgi:hypothetical protein
MLITRPWWDQRWVTDVVWQFALIPLAFLAVLRALGRRINEALWWMAGAFALSWVADAPVDHIPKLYHWVPSAVYPVSQSAIFGRALLLKVRYEMILLGVLTAVGLIAGLWTGAKGPDILLHTVAYLAVCVVVADRPEIPARLQISLFVYFGLGWVAWLVHARFLIVPTTYYPYQFVRFAGLLLFCWAAMKPGPTLQLARTE